jgi:hypothetical protein
MITDTTDTSCPGPLVWYFCHEPADGAVLHCLACGYVTITGNPNDALHTYTPTMREGLA